MTRFASLAVTLALLALAGGCGTGDGTGDSSDMLASHPPLEGTAPRSFFGDAVAVSGDTLAVGAWGAADSTGRVGVFEFLGGAWHEAALLVHPDPRAGDRFGHSLALEGDQLVVTAPNRSVGGTPRAGEVYVYRESEGDWRLEQVLTPATPVEDGHFGTAAAISGGTLAVVEAAAPRQRLHVYERYSGSWRLLASIPLDPSGVAHALAVDGDMLAVGARSTGEAGDPERRSGWLRIFVREGSAWRESRPPQPAGDHGECFGCSLALSGGVLAVGSPAPTGGSAFVFERLDGGWLETGRLSSGPGSDHFATSLALADGALFVGAPGDDRRAENAGMLHVYLEGPGGWRLHAELSPAAVPEQGGFGGRLSSDGESLAVGASGKDTATGAVLVIPVSTLIPTGSGPR